METGKRISPGYKPGATTRELASNLSFALWERIRQEADAEMMELLNLHGSMEAIACGLWEDDCLADPLGSIVEVLQFLDGKQDESPNRNATHP